MTDKTDIVWRLRANWSYLGREASDEITRLRNQVEQLQSEAADAKKWAMSERSQRMGLWRSEWISVRDRLPPVDEKVLYTCFMEGDGPIDYFTEVNAGYWDGKARNLPGNPAMKYDDSNDWEPCSHWMPLPETPAL